LCVPLKRGDVVDRSKRDRVFESVALKQPLDRHLELLAGERAGTAGVSMIASGTWRGDDRALIRVVIIERNSSSRVAPGPHHEQRHVVGAVGALDADDQAVGHLRELFDGGVDLGRSDTNPLAVERRVRSGGHGHRCAGRS
jgi:hypothetical protein